MMSDFKGKNWICADLPVVAEEISKILLYPGHYWIKQRFRLFRRKEVAILLSTARATCCFPRHRFEQSWIESSYLCKRA